METKVKEGFFKSVWKAITDFEKYKEFANFRTPKVLKYLVTLLILFSILVVFAVSFPTMKVLLQGIDYFKNEFPDLNYKNGVLDVHSDEPIYLRNEEYNLDAIVIIDTKASLEQQDKYVDEQKNRETAILLFNDKMIVKTPALAAYTTYEYTSLQENLNLDSFNKQELVDKFSGNNVYKLYCAIYLFFFAYMFLTYIVMVIGNIVILSLLAFLISWLYKVNLKYINCLKIASYALTLPLVLQIIYVYINTFTGFTIQYFTVAYDIISYIYVITAILIIKSDLAKQDVGLTKEVQIKKDDENEIISNEEVEKQKQNKKKKDGNNDEKKKVDPDVEPGRA